MGVIAQGLIQKARSGNVTAMIFFLKTQVGWRETTAIAYSGSIGNEPTTQDVEEAASAFLARITALQAAVAVETAIDAVAVAPLMAPRP